LGYRGHLRGRIAARKPSLHINELRCRTMAMQIDTRFPPLEQITRPTVETAAAAYYLNRQQQTLRGWACLENGPLRPLRINGRLAWPVADLRRVLGVSA
jgi:hypothetical protein